MKKIRVRIDCVGFPTVGKIDVQELADALGWNPNGDHVAGVWSELSSGRSVEVATRRQQRATFWIYPLADGEDGAQIPRSAAICVRF